MTKEQLESLELAAKSNLWRIEAALNITETIGTDPHLSGIVQVLWDAEQAQRKIADELEEHCCNAYGQRRHRRRERRPHRRVWTRRTYGTTPRRKLGRYERQ